MIGQINRCILSINVTFMDDTATHSVDYANSLADSPILAKQIMDLSIINWTSVPITHQVSLTVCCTADHPHWKTMTPGMTSAYFCVCCIYTFVSRKVFPIKCESLGVNPVLLHLAEWTMLKFLLVKNFSKTCRTYRCKTAIWECTR